MHGCEALGEAVAQPQNLLRLEASARQDLGQRLAFDELHDEVAQIALATEQALIIDDRVVVHAAKFACFLDQKL